MSQFLEYIPYIVDTRIYIADAELDLDQTDLLRQFFRSFSSLRSFMAVPPVLKAVSILRAPLLIMFLGLFLIAAH